MWRWMLRLGIHIVPHLKITQTGVEIGVKQIFVERVCKFAQSYRGEIDTNLSKCLFSRVFWCFFEHVGYDLFVRIVADEFIIPKWLKWPPPYYNTLSKRVDFLRAIWMCNITLTSNDNCSQLSADQNASSSRSTYATKRQRRHNMRCTIGATHKLSFMNPASISNMWSGQVIVGQWFGCTRRRTICNWIWRRKLNHPLSAKTEKFVGLAPRGCKIGWTDKSPFHSDGWTRILW